MYEFLKFFLNSLISILNLNSVYCAHEVGINDLSLVFKQFDFTALFSAATSQERKAREIRIVAKIVHLQVVLMLLSP